MTHETAAAYADEDAAQERTAMIDWHNVWRNPKPSELDAFLPFGFGRADDLPLAAYSVTLLISA
jgi:hypothetical protein